MWTKKSTIEKPKKKKQKINCIHVNNLKLHTHTWWIYNDTRIYIVSRPHIYLNGQGRGTYISNITAKIQVQNACQNEWKAKSLTTTIATTSTAKMRIIIKSAYYSDCIGHR